MPPVPANAPAAAFVERRRHPALRWLWRIAFGTLFGAWSLVLLAWLTLHWGILPRIEQWRPQIEARASLALGVPVSIGTIRVRSSGWVPAFELSDVVLKDRLQREALRLPKVNAAVSARSLLALELRFEQLHIDGAALEVRRDAAGRIFVAGIEIPPGGAEADSFAADWFFSQHEFVVRNGRLRWIDEQRQAPALELEGVDLVVRNGFRRHEVRLDATPPPAWGERFSVQGRFTQSLLDASGDWRRWDGSLHVSLPRTDVAELRRHVTLPFELGAGEGALRAWIDVRRGQAQAATADVALRAVAVRLAPSVEPLAFAEVRGRIGAERSQGQLKFSAAGLTFATTDGVLWPRSNFTLTLRQAADAKPDTMAFSGGELSADLLDLGVMAQVASRVPLGAALAKGLGELAPSGRVTALAAQWSGPLDAPSQYKVKASVAGLSIAAAPSADAAVVGRPGWRNASIELDANEAGGKARLGLDKGALILPGVFEQAEVALDSFSTQLSWRIRAAEKGGAAPGLELTLSDTRFANADAQGELSVLRWQTGAGAAGAAHGRGARFPGRLELVGSLTRGRAAAVARYLPLGVHESARRYVQHAVLDGRVAGASFRVNGDLWDFPFGAPAAPGTGTHTGGEFRIAARAEDVTLAYVPDEPGRASPWPAFTQVQGELVFERNAMEIRNARARMYGVELTRVNGTIRDLTQPLLRIEGQGRGPLADLLRYTEATPIGEWTGHALRGATGTGAADLTLKLEIPISDVPRSTVQGRVTLGGNDVRLSSAMPLLAGAKARVDFSQQGFSIAGGSARVLGGDLSIEGGAQPDGSQRFVAQGVASADALRRAPELGALSRLAVHLSGQTTYRLALGIVRGQTEFSLTSPMTGLAIDLPAPLKKSAEAAWPLRAESRLTSGASAEPARDTLRVELGNVIQAQYQRDLSRDSPQVQRGAIAVLDALPPLPERGVHALLNLATVDGDAWQALADRLQAAPGDAVGAGAAVDDGYLPRTVALRAQALSSGGRRLTRLVAGVSQDTEATWRGSLDADQLGGYVEYRAASGANNPGRIYARLARLALPPSDADSVENLLVQAPASVPALDIVIDDFELRGKKFGRVEIEAANRAAEGGGREWRMNRFAVSNPDAQLTGTGQWRPGSGVGRQRMVMDFKLELANSGAALERLGFPGTMRGGKGRLSGQLQWAGSPLSLHVPSLDGRMHLALDAGQFLKAGPGAARLLSVLNLQALPRRLLLDFRDVFQEGFAFDNVGGDVTINDGVAGTNNLRMRGVQAAVLMEGNADIARETQDLRVLVVPEINAGTASLAYAVINPAIGLGSFLAQLFLRRPLMAASTREFTVQGSWAEPRVERVERRFDAPLPDMDPPAAASAPRQ
ncbi:MAG: YhdP family protein [Pseudomonadota bacterium]